MEDEIKTEETVVEEVSFIQGIVQEVVGSPLNLILIAIITFLIYKIFQSRKPSPAAVVEP